jgi:hypothetical protein
MSKYSFTIKPDKLGDFEKKLPAKYMKVLAEASKRAAAEGIVALRKATIEAAPTHDGGAVGAVASGKLRDGWRIKLVQSKMTVQITNTARDVKRPYVDYVEYGRPAGAKRPPVNAILRWMKAKGIHATNMKRMAEGIARNIAKRGIKARLIILGKSGSRLAGFAKSHYKHFRALMGPELGSD